MSWVSVLQALLLGAGAVAAATIGALVNQRGAKAIAREAIEGQRRLARDAALRDWRRQEISPCLEAAKGRFLLWRKRLDVLSREDLEQRKEGLELDRKLTDPRFDALFATSHALPNDAVRSAFTKFVNAEGKFHEGYTKQEIMDKVENMTLALAELNTAAEHFVYGP